MTSLCTYQLGDLWCAIPTIEVREILPLPQLTKVPSSPDWVVGLVNLRGEVLAVVDVTRHLGVLRISPSPQKFLIVIDAEHDFAVAVDEVGGVTTPEPHQFRDPTANTPSLLRPFVKGSFDMDGTLFQLIDLASLACEVSS